MTGAADVLRTVRLAVKDKNNRLPGFVCLHSAPSSCFYRLAGKVAILTTAPDCNKCTDAKTTRRQLHHAVTPLYNCISTPPTGSIMQATDGSTPTSATATQASRLFPKTAAANAPQPAQRPAATGTASYHHPFLLCCMHVLVVDITFQYCVQLLWPFGSCSCCKHRAIATCSLSLHYACVQSADNVATTIRCPLRPSDPVPAHLLTGQHL